MTHRRILSTRDLVTVGLFVAITAALAQFNIPMPLGVPATLQTFGVLLAGIVLGASKGALSIALYVLLGAIGVPVFAGFRGGIGVVFGPTGGFIFTFPIMALIAGLGANKGGKIRLALGIAAGCAINYLCGILMFAWATGKGLAIAFSACVLPFIPGDVLKTTLAAFLGVRLRAVLEKQGLLE